MIEVLKALQLSIKLFEHKNVGLVARNLQHTETLQIIVTAMIAIKIQIKQFQLKFQISFQ